MRLLMSATSVLFFATAVNGCSDSSGPQSTETQWVVGVWSAFTSAPSKSLGMSLVLHGATVTGPGNWCENLVCGTTSVTGTVTGNTVHIVTTFDTGRIETFDGTLEISKHHCGIRDRDLARRADSTPGRPDLSADYG